MLQQTFLHVPGIGEKSERTLWAHGVTDWSAARGTGPLPIGAAARSRLRQYLERSQEALEAGDARFFADLLPSAHHWRMFAEFRHRVAYLDIETTGLTWPHDHITTIALYDGRTVRHYVSGRNLDEFAGDIDDYALLVTYNGKCFDVPFIESILGRPLRHAHIDLRYVLKSLGYTGGLKGCERTLGFDRGELGDVDGYVAVLLWYEFQRTGNEAALETLLAYNVEDVLTLERLAVLAYNRKLAATPFAAQRLPAPPPVANPFAPDTELLRGLLRRMEVRFW